MSLALWVAVILAGLPGFGQEQQSPFGAEQNPNRVAGRNRREYCLRVLLTVDEGIKNLHLTSMEFGVGELESAHTAPVNAADAARWDLAELQAEFASKKLRWGVWATGERILFRQETGQKRAGGGLESFDAPDQAGGPGFLSGERGAPEGENL